MLTECFPLSDARKSIWYGQCNDIDVIVLFTSGPHLRHNYHGNKTLETMLSGFVEFVGHRLNRPVLLHLCVSCSSYKQRHSQFQPCNTRIRA